MAHGGERYGGIGLAAEAVSNGRSANLVATSLKGQAGYSFNDYLAVEVEGTLALSNDTDFEFSNGMQIFGLL